MGILNSPFYCYNNIEKKNKYFESEKEGGYLNGIF